MIGDTDFFIDLMHPQRPRHPAALRKTRELEARGIRIVMTAITRFELAVGVGLYAEGAAERERVLTLLREHATYALDGPAADRAGALQGELRERGLTLGVADALIAGIALEHEEELLTRNEKDFSRVDRLRTVSY